MFLKEWKWSNGEDNVRTPRTKINIFDKSNEKSSDKNIVLNSEHTNTYDNTIHQSLENYDSFNFEPLFSRNESEMGKIREDLDDKLSNRELIFQRGMNPFLKTTNYVNDIVARDIFLKPKNTTFDKIKFNEE